MGMSIDDCIKIIKTWLHKGTGGLTDTRLGYMEGWFHKTDKEAFETAIETMRKYQQLKADYENRLKADMVAMLTEIQLEIEEKEQYYQDKFLDSKNAVHDAAMGGRMFGCGECKEVIQQKINELKGESND